MRSSCYSFDFGKTPSRCPPLAASALSCCLLPFLSGLPLSAADVDTSKLPPAATTQIDFTRDIKPILEASCLRCHGPEKPKSGFRLDNPQSALKGGENGVDILPGKSALSPLIHYVAYLVPDMEMPPPGKGEQLTPAQVSLLRAWIDQGAIWETALPTNIVTALIAPIAGGTIVNGDSHKFQELYWQKAGANGGLEQFQFFEQPSPDTRISLSGHAFLNDYQVVLSMNRNDLGYITSGWQQYRKYYDGSGGFFPTPTNSTPMLPGDIFLDIGKAWFDFGLTLPDWPVMVLGYEYDYRHGSEATTSWGAFGSGADLRNRAPARIDIQEGLHVLKFNLDDDIKGFTLEERFRGEFYKLDTQYTNNAARGPVANDTSEGNRYFQAVNTLRLEKQFTPWLYGSAGYLFSKLDADATFTDDVSFFNILTFLSTVSNITLERESEVLNFNGLLGPFDGFTASAGVQSEWDRQHGFGSGTLNNIAYTFTAPLDLAVNPATLSSQYDENTTSETLALRYSKIPFTALFAEARCQQQRIQQSDVDLQPSGNFEEDPTYTSQSEDARVGFNTSPWRMFSWSAHYRRYEDDERFETNQIALPAGGYPGLLRERFELTDEIETKLVLHPCHWLRTTLTYQYQTTDYREDTNPTFTPGPPLASISPGGALLSGFYRSHVYSANVTLTPGPRLSLGTTFSYQPTSITTASADSPAIVPYQGAICSVLANGAYVVSPTTGLFANYSYSEADYAQNNFAAGLPVGLEYLQQAARIGLTHSFGKRVSAKLQYGYFFYSEPSSGRADNFTAHAIFGTMTFRFR
jgi:mono/diheme cytochrome c family protein